MLASGAQWPHDFAGNTAAIPGKHGQSCGHSIGTHQTVVVLITIGLTAFACLCPAFQQISTEFAIGTQFLQVSHSQVPVCTLHSAVIIYCDCNGGADPTSSFLLDVIALHHAVWWLTGTLWNSVWTIDLDDPVWRLDELLTPHRLNLDQTWLRVSYFTRVIRKELGVCINLLYLFHLTQLHVPNPEI